MPKDVQIIDLGNAKQRQMVLAFIKAQPAGLYWFDLRRCKDQRSLAQNAYLWGVVYPAVARGVSEAWGERITVDEAHEMLKRRFLAKPIINRRNGELMECSTGSSASLDVSEFGEYLDKISKFAAEFLGVEIPQSDRMAVVT